MARDDSVRDLVERLELPFNSLGVDPYGISKKHLTFFFSALGFMYRRYFRVKAVGLENVPPRGRAMLVGNHSGGYAIDGAMVLTSMLLEMNPPRLAQGMVEKFMAALPLSSTWTARCGQLTGLPEHAERLLLDDRLLMVFPEGAKGTAKLFKERHSLVDFGTGFVRLALKTKTPIVPLGFVGGGEAVPTVMNSRTLGKLMGVPYVPITPYGIAAPLPTKLVVHYGKPMVFPGNGDEEDSVIKGWVDQVKAQIATLIESARADRKGELTAEAKS
ncbi:MAG: 1-acyl-sn-glycerol-3-phosphate acyltransferase [Myxococcaceae bacterium]